MAGLCFQNTHLNNIFFDRLYFFIIIIIIILISVIIIDLRSFSIFRIEPPPPPPTTTLKMRFYKSIEKISRPASCAVWTYNFIMPLYQYTTISSDHIFTSLATYSVEVLTYCYICHYTLPHINRSYEQPIFIINFLHN